MTYPAPDPAALLADVRGWVQVSVGALDDEQLSTVIMSETLIQAAYCDSPDPYPDSLLQALYRRVARVVAARGVPLGLAGVESETGGTRLPSFDPEIERLEGPYRRIPVS